MARHAAKLKQLERGHMFANHLDDGLTAHEPLNAVQGLRFRCYSWARGYHSWTREPRHPVHVTDIYATESQTPLESDLSAIAFQSDCYCTVVHQCRVRLEESAKVCRGQAPLCSQCRKTTHLLSLQITTNSSSL